MQTEELEQTPAPAAPSLREEVEIEFIDPNPLEPRSRLVADPELIQSIRENGLLQPIVVRTVGDRFEVMAGHRRLAACRELGRKTIPALVFTGEVNSGAILLAENVVRKDFDPLDEAAIVAALIEQGATQQAIADALGHSVPWVARRANLATLSPKARKLTRDPESPLATWPPAWLEELALLSPKAQDEFIEHDLNLRYRSIEDLREDVRERMRPLRLAPWDIADATLQRSAGSCIDCPKTSCAVTGLFGPEATGSLEKAVCRDSHCWDGKRAEWFGRRLKEAKEKHGAGVLFFQPTNGTSYADEQQARQLIPKGAAPVESWKWKKTSEKKGKPAIALSGPDFGKVVFIAEQRGGAGVAGSKPIGVELKRKALHRRWWRRVLDRLVSAIQERELEDVLRVVARKRPHKAVADQLALVAQLLARAAAEFGGVLNGTIEGHEQAVKLAGAKGHGFAPVDRLPELLWVGLRGDLAEEARRAISKVGHSLKADRTCLEHLGWVIEAVEFDVAAELALVVAELPEPKSWAGKGAGRKPKQRALATEEDSAPIPDDEREVEEDEAEDEDAA